MSPEHQSCAHGAAPPARPPAHLAELAVEDQDVAVLQLRRGQRGGGGQPVHHHARLELDLLVHLEQNTLGGTRLGAFEGAPRSARMRPPRGRAVDEGETRVRGLPGALLHTRSGACQRRRAACRGTPQRRPALPALLSELPPSPSRAPLPARSPPGCPASAAAAPAPAFGWRPARRRGAGLGVTPEHKAWQAQYGGEASAVWGRGKRSAGAKQAQYGGDAAPPSPPCALASLPLCVWGPGRGGLLARRPAPPCPGVPGTHGAPAARPTTQRTTLVNGKKPRTLTLVSLGTRRRPA